MKTRNYRNGNSTCKTYQKPAGRGWEVGFLYGTKPLFVGNFVHSREANEFYSIMKREVGKFAKRYKVGKTYSQSWFKAFIGAHLHKYYYAYVNKQIRKHYTWANQTYGKNLRTYKRISRRWAPQEKTPCLRAA
mgnify:CR=1 FL=1